MNVIYFTLCDKRYKYNQLKIIDNRKYYCLNIFDFNRDDELLNNRIDEDKFAFKNIHLLKTLSRRLKDNRFDEYKELYEQLKNNIR